MDKGVFLIVAHLPHFFITFLCSNIQLLQSLGYEVHCVSNFQLDNEAEESLHKMGVITHQIDIQRSPYSLKNILAVRQMLGVIQQINAVGVHCHTPTGGVVARLAAKLAGVHPVIYTAHGFHFWKGAPLKNWLCYFPVEWLCAYWTDVLITINQEDYDLAKRHMHAKRVEYIPGVGIDLDKFSPEILSQEMKLKKRDELGLAGDEKMLLSVGELIPRKNHEVVIRALAQINDKKLKYYICGQGELKEKLQDLIDELGLTESVKLLGYRNDISELCECADLFIFPSLQEGLPVALMEAIASKTPVVCSDIRGNRDLVDQQELYDCTDTDGIAKKLRESIQNDHTEEIERNYRNLKKYDLAAVISDMEILYSSGGVRHLYDVYKQQLLRRTIGIPLDAVLLLSVGELNFNKNHKVVIRALAKLNDDSIHYAIAGTGNLRDYLIELANSLGIGDRVHLLGYRDDVAKLYKAADMCVFPSIREGLGLAAVEGMASGLPLICADNRGTHDYAINGENAIVCKYNDVNQFAKAIRTMTSDLEMRTKMGLKNYTMAKHYDYNIVTAKMKKVYKEFIC